MRHLAVALTVLLIGGLCLAQPPANVCPDPSVEATKQKDQFGIPYGQWGGWIFEGSPEFRNGKIARTGDTCAEIVGAQGGKIRLYTPAVTVAPGRYRFTCYLRGLDIGKHVWNISEDFNFGDDKYMSLTKTGTFGWTKITIVRDVPKQQEIVARIGLWAGGRLWVDDAEVVPVGNDVPVTDTPIVGEEEAPIAPPGPLDAAKAVRCPDCGYRNMAEWRKCYVCGAELGAGTVASDLPPTKPLASFEDGTVKPFTPAEGAAVQEHATDGQWALRIDKNWMSWDGAIDFSGYDFFKADVFNPSPAPADLYVEVRDKGTTGYWTRVNYLTVVPPGPSVLIVPTDLYVGEKSRPGRPLDKANITRFVLSVGENGPSVYFDNLRLERDLSDRVKVPGLQAYSFGPGTSPPLRGFTQITPSTQYSPGRGYGFDKAQIWRAFDVLQPDPLYQTFICIEGGGFAVDVPNGKVHVFMNLDNPSGFWGEVQVYRQRTVRANGVEVVNDKMDLAAFTKRYYRFAETEDSPLESTFDKYQRAYFSEKEFDAEVTNGRLLLEFSGANWANSLSTIVLYPADQADAGRKYLDNLRERRRFYFDNYFKRILPDPQKDALSPIPDFVPTPPETQAGYALFARDWMADVSVNSLPRREEVTRELDVFAAAGELEPIVFSVYPLQDKGPVTVAATALQGPDGATIPAEAISLGVVSHRLSRVTMEGTVYTIAPRFVMPRNTAEIRKGVTTTFWLTLRTPNPVRPGIYRGRINLTFADGKKDSLDLQARLFATPLDEVDVPAGPWGCSIDLPWYGEDLGDYNQTMLRKCLAKLRETGCTSFSGMPRLRIRGWPSTGSGPGGKDRVPDIDFTAADAEMAEAKAAGFRQMIVNYNGGIQGFNNYLVDNAAMKNAGFDNYTDFLRAVLTAVNNHAKSAGWLPVAFNLCDEPIGDAIPPTAANAKAWRDAAPPGTITTGATSIQSPQPDDPHLPLVQALQIANLNGHDEAAIKLIHDAGNGWAFYNGGNRWTFGTYMMKAVQAGMKFRLSWHWNCSAGDPYYALDCREDDYSWCHANAAGDLIPSLHFEREIREGLDDYRYMQTLARLLKAKPNHPAAAAAQKLIADKLAGFQLGERNHEAKWPLGEYRAYRLQLAEAIERMGK